MLSRWVENKELECSVSVPYPQGAEPGSANIGYFDKHGEKTVS